MPSVTNATTGRTRPLPPPLSAHAFDTTPGARSALAPPPGFDGDKDQYVEVIRRRSRHRTTPPGGPCRLCPARASQSPAPAAASAS